MPYLIYIFVVSTIIWVLGILAAAYHVFSYHLPGDGTIRSFFLFLAVSGGVFIGVLYFLITELGA